MVRLRHFYTLLPFVKESFKVVHAVNLLNPLPVLFWGFQYHTAFINLTCCSLYSEEIDFTCHCCLFLTCSNITRAFQFQPSTCSCKLTTSGSLTQPPPPLFPDSPLVAPANTSVSLPLQLMKATVLVESSILYSFSSSSVHSSDVYES